jgi:L-alanine-DL-glutamate epimerase-like enolase superfamily enzyme
MKIVDVRHIPCHQGMRDASWKFARSAVARIEGFVIILRDDDGVEGMGYVHAVPAISTNGAAAVASLDFLGPSLIGRSLSCLAEISDHLDRLLAFQPSVKAGVDMAMHDLLARKLGIPIHVLLGGKYRDAVPLARIVPIKKPEDMATAALALTVEGYKCLKLKLSGDTDLDIARVAAVRQIIGPDIRITLDPNQSYNVKQMMRAFARMEKNDISLIEQPVPANDWQGLALLTRTLPVDIEADESAQSVQDVFRLVSDRVVDVINIKVTKMGGLGRFMQAMHICEAGGVTSRLGAAFGPSLMQAASVQAASAIPSLPHACELAEHLQLDGDPFTPLEIDQGMMTVPKDPGCGARLT